jgi:hypothetical protein
MKARGEGRDGVDKLQGRQAPARIYSVASSSADDVLSGVEAAVRSRDKLLSSAQGTLLDMHRQTWVSRDAQGNVTGSTEVRSSSGCGGCLWVLLGAFLVAAPAAWSSDGQIPVAVAGLMYAVEGLVAIAALRQYSKRK